MTQDKFEEFNSQHKSINEQGIPVFADTQEFKTLSEKIQTLEDLFNEFLRKWTGDNFPHLIDSDENDGELFRQKLLELAGDDLI